MEHFIVSVITWNLVEPVMCVIIAVAVFFPCDSLRSSVMFDFLLIQILSHIGAINSKQKNHAGAMRWESGMVSNWSKRDLILCILSPKAIEVENYFFWYKFGLIFEVTFCVHSNLSDFFLFAQSISKCWVDR